MQFYTFPVNLLKKSGVLYFNVSKLHLTVFFVSLNIIWKIWKLWMFSPNKKNPPWLVMMMMNCFCGMVDWREAFTPYYQPGTLSEILTIAYLLTCCKQRLNLHRIWVQTLLCSSENYYTTAPVVQSQLFLKTINYFKNYYHLHLEISLMCCYFIIYL